MTEPEIWPRGRRTVTKRIRACSHAWLLYDRTAPDRHVERQIGVRPAERGARGVRGVRGIRGMRGVRAFPRSFRDHRHLVF